MKRPLRPEEMRLWGTVAATVHPLPGRAAPKPPDEPAPEPARPAPAARSPLGPAPRPAPAPRLGTYPIEPRRLTRIARERDPISARIDLHGLDQDRARAALETFLARAWDDGHRSVLVITGKGSRGDGVLRKRVPEWLAAPALAAIVAGIAEAHRRHGGEGALYVALKRRPRS